MWITLEQIQYLQEINRQGSLSKAADKLLRSKSAVTKGIQNLEEQVGFEVLDRREYRVRLTDRGQAFLQQAGGILKSVADLKDACEQIGTQVEARLSLSVASPYDSRRLYPMIKTASGLFPRTQIILHRETLSGEKMLLEELVDIAIIEGQQSHRELDARLLGRIEFIMMIASDHPYLRLPRETRTIRDLYRYPQIVQTSSLDRAAVSYGVHKDAVKWFVSDLYSKKEIIRHGLGWGRLPQHEVEVEREAGTLLHLSEIKNDDGIDIYLAKRKNFALGKVGQYIWDNL